jgi:hypothetical protein
MNGALMILNGPFQVFIGGALGWVLVQLAKFGLAAVNGSSPLDQKYFSLLFWAGAISLIIVSGVCAILNGVEGVPLIKAVQFGINAPAIISGLATESKLRRARKPTIGMAPNRNKWMEAFLAQSW